MKRKVYRYVFNEEVSLLGARNSLLLAIAAAEGLYGAARVRLEAGFFFSEAKRACAVDANTSIGEAVVRIFTGFLIREFGDEAFTVELAPTPRPARRTMLDTGPNLRC